MAGSWREQSPAVDVLVGELLSHKKLAIGVLIVTVIDAGLVFGVAPYMVSLFAEKVTTQQFDSLRELTWWVAGLSVVHATLFFLRVRWRRTLAARGRTGLSRRLDGAVSRADVAATRKAGTMQGEAQKLPEAWLDLTFNLTEAFIPFVCGSICLVVFVAIRAPLFIAPILVLIAGGCAVALKSGRSFSAKNRLLSEAAKRESRVFDSMFAVTRMKWLIAKLSHFRDISSREFEEIYKEQAKDNARWQSVLMVLGSVLQVAAIAGGSSLVGMGYSPSVAVLIVLLGYALGDKFGSITNMICVYDWVLFRVKSPAAFVKDVERRNTLSHLPRDEARGYTFRRVTAIYGDERVALPDVTLRRGETTVIRGASGSGKSTFLSVADGSVPYEGSVLLGGHEVREWDVSGCIINGSQSFGAVEMSLHQLLGENVDEMARDMALMCSAYPEVDLSKPLESLSGGQRQRVMLAAVIYHTLTDGFDDGILLIDEPTTGLGARETKILVRGFRRLAMLRPNLTIIITTHEGRLVRLADQVVAFTGKGGAVVKCRINGKLVQFDG
jgi:ABC-type bacteriocin/lantibiotic exporter with double-glycine peptidase domain